MTRASAFVLGYHGCDKAVGEKILAGGEHLQASDNDYDWLGSGIYFWENSARRALDWAKFAKEHPKFTRTQIREPFVIGAIVDLGNCLDLLEAESIRTVERGYKIFKEGCEIMGTSLPLNKTLEKGRRLRSLNCAVINFVHVMRENEDELAFDTVRAAFIEGPPIYENAGFHLQTHVQICVRNPMQTIGYFRPLGT